MEMYTDIAPAHPMSVSMAVVAGLSEELLSLGVIVMSTLLAV